MTKLQRLTEWIIQIIIILGFTYALLGSFGMEHKHYIEIFQGKAPVREPSQDNLNTDTPISAPDKSNQPRALGTNEVETIQSGKDGAASKSPAPEKPN